MPVEFASARLGKRAGVWPGSAARRGGGQIEVVICARRGGVLSVDDREPNARILRVIPKALEPGDGGRLVETFPTRPVPEGQPIVEGPENAARIDSGGVP